MGFEHSTWVFLRKYYTLTVTNIKSSILAKCVSLLGLLPHDELCTTEWNVPLWNPLYPCSWGIPGRLSSPEILPLLPRVRSPVTSVLQVILLPLLGDSAAEDTFLVPSVLCLLSTCLPPQGTFCVLAHLSSPLLLSGAPGLINKDHHRTSVYVDACISASTWSKECEIGELALFGGTLHLM